MVTTRVIYLHGAPAVGKLTVAEAIRTRHPAALIDNHVLIDFAKSVLDFGVPGFFDLMGSARILALKYAVQYRVPLVIVTSCYSDPHDRETLEGIEAELEQPEVSFLPAFLHCSQEAQRGRVGSRSRAERGKLTSPGALDNFTKDWNFVAVPRSNCFRVDTTDISPDEAAVEILAHFGIEHDKSIDFRR